MATLLLRSRPRNPIFSTTLFSLLLFRNPNPNPSPSPFSSIPTATGTPTLRVSPEESSAAEADDLRRRLLRLRFDRRSAAAALDEWVRGGGEVAISELRRIIAELRKAKRYKHALEILTWMESCRKFELASSDHAAILDLITKLRNISEAEEYFGKLSTSASKKAASFPLLHYYVKARDLEKAETLMAKLQNYGLAVNPYLFDEMMKLYVATSQYKKVLAVIRHMKNSKIPLNVVSYNLWMNACAEVSNATSVEMVLKEMVNDKDIEVGWSTHSTLANIYIKYGLIQKAFEALRTAEQKLSARKRLGYSFIMTIYASLRDREGVIRLWEASKKVPSRITCVNYMCVMLCLIKVGDIGAAERVFRTWESECFKYDVRVSNVLLGAYVRNGWMEKAEKFHLYTLEKGAKPNYKTWEILMEGWVKNREMEKAVEAMKKGFSLLKFCRWRPNPAIVEAIAEHFEEEGDFENAKRYVKVLRKLNIMSLPLYKSFIRVCINTKRAPPNIPKMMARDQIDLDDETAELIIRANEIDIVDIL
ncbi:Pentatricopeptide repeat-containing protein [Ananas comosus]|uniref:Pentatricopeptide repeat-containing protein n=1 Tax=Ananas comosus TaxID=4615 RepID=A0A199UX37_ANACO|nr:Pentatricopeptide repeat-containing protein [Ananas comosus]